MKRLRLTTAQALVRYLIAQRTLYEGREQPLFGGVFALLVIGWQLRRERLRQWRAAAP